MALAFPDSSLPAPKVRENLGDECMPENCAANTVKPRHSAPAFNKTPPIEHMNFGFKKYFCSYLYVGNTVNLSKGYNFDQSLEMPLSSNISLFAPSFFFFIP